MAREAEAAAKKQAKREAKVLPPLPLLLRWHRTAGEGDQEDEDAADKPTKPAAATNILTDPRFAQIFTDPAFQIDTSSREFAMLNLPLRSTRLAMDHANSLRSKTRRTRAIANPSIRTWRTMPPLSDDDDQDGQGGDSGDSSTKATWVNTIPAHEMRPVRDRRTSTKHLRLRGTRLAAKLAKVDVELVRDSSTMTMTKMVEGGGIRSAALRIDSSLLRLLPLQQVVV